MNPQEELCSALLDLDEAVDRLSRGVNAVGGMCAAVDTDQNYYAQGLYAVWEYLREADDGVRRRLDLCLERMKQYTVR